VARVGVVGAANADYIVRVDRLPQPGETVGGGQLSVRPGGKGANQAHAAGRLGADVLLVASVGDDTAATAERAALAADGVSCDGLAVAAGPTGVAVILVDAHGENAIAVAPGANDSLTAETVTQRLHNWLAHGSVVLISLEVPMAAAVAAAQAAAASGALTVVNPAPASPLPELLVRGAILTPNEGEVRRLVPEAGTEQAAISALLAAGAASVVVTRGERGSSLFRPATRTSGAAPAAASATDAASAVDISTPAVDIAAPAVDVVDTVGAGDAFNGALAWSLACGAPLEAAVRAATAAGAAACTATGARDALPTPEALATLLGPAAFAAVTRPV
jgi:ribokinase